MCTLAVGHRLPLGALPAHLHQQRHDYHYTDADDDEDADDDGADWALGHNAQC